MARKATTQMTTIGIDIGKNTFHVIGLDSDGHIVLPPPSEGLVSGVKQTLLVRGCQDRS